MLEWKGPGVLTKVERATKLGIDETMTECVKRAKNDAPVVSGTYHGSIQMRPSTKDQKGIVGFWGSFQVLYAVFIELGTKAHVIKPKTAGALFWPGAAHPVGAVKHPGTKAQRILNGAAEEEYPKLSRRIRSHM